MCVDEVACRSLAMIVAGLSFMFLGVSTLMVAYAVPSLFSL